MFTRKKVFWALATAAIAVYIITYDDAAERIHALNMAPQSEQADPAPEIAPVRAQSI